ncbi:MAG TPA: hypothetical protein VNO75_12810, partial [Gemmatimonadaceae bacterium]|nr:hypothetical protein [Gemmatimonadaceae bacterium]
NGTLAYSAEIDGRATPFDSEMQVWLSSFLPRVLREAGINVPARVARLRARGGVPAVLDEIGEIRSTGAKRTHYEELLKSAPLNPAEARTVIAQVGPDLGASSGDLSSVLQKMPRTAVRSSLARSALADAIARIRSSGDMTNTLQALAPNADTETLVMLADVAEDIPSSGDKANFLMSTASQYLTPNDHRLRTAFFRTAATVVSDGDLSNVLISAMPYGHASPAVTMEVIRTTEEIRSDGDISNVLRSLAGQRLLADRTAATVAVIDRTMTMRSSGDRANVLLVLVGHDLVSTPAIRAAYGRAGAAIPSSGDRANVLAALARQ